jgi:hypothetical protein
VFYPIKQISGNGKYWNRGHFSIFLESDIFARAVSRIKTSLLVFSINLLFGSPRKILKNGQYF